MIVQLEILSKSRGVMRVNVYRVTSQSREKISSKKGTIGQIKYQLEQEFSESVKIEKSVFDGWY